LLRVIANKRSECGNLFSLLQYRDATTVTDYFGKNRHLMTDTILSLQSRLIGEAIC